MSLYLVCSPPKSFFPVLITFFPLLNFLTLFLKFIKFAAQLIPLINKLTHLRQQNNISHIESTVLMVVIKVGISLSSHVLFTNIAVKLIAIHLYLGDIN